MRVNAKADYAIRAMVELATAPEGEVVTREAVAEAQGVPSNFLGSIMTELRRGGLVVSHRGNEGGYRLARPPAEISVADIIRVVDGPLASVHGRRPQDVAYQGRAVVLRPLWVAVRASLREVLENVTLAHLVDGELPRGVVALTEDEEAWRDH